MTIRRTLAAILAASAIAAPAASALPADTHGSKAPAAAFQQRDLRSPDAIDAAQHPRKSPLLASPGHPSEAANTIPLPPVTAQPAKSDDGIDWSTIGLGVAGTLLALGAIVALTNRRHVPHTRVTVWPTDRDRAPGRIRPGAPRSCPPLRSPCKPGGLTEVG